MELPHEEKTLLLIKPDAISRGLIAECIKRFEQRGFQVRAMKMIQASEEQMRGHYSGGDEWVAAMGVRTIGDLERYGKDVHEEFGTTDPLEIGKVVVDWLVSYMSESPVIAIVMSGLNVVEMSRKIIGNTSPQKADLGSLRGDLSIDSPIVAMIEKRPLTNLMHASGNAEEAEKEIKHWFTDAEIYSHPAK